MGSGGHGNEVLLTSASHMTRRSCSRFSWNFKRKFCRKCFGKGVVAGFGFPALLSVCEEQGEVDTARWTLSSCIAVCSETGF